MPVLCEGVLDDGAHLRKMLAELGGDFGVMGVLQHTQQVVVHKHLHGVAVSHCHQGVSWG